MVIPVFNEEDSIDITLGKIKETLKKIHLFYEIIIVNDGSTDNTLEILKKNEKLGNYVRIISYSPNMGKGYAVKTGIKHSCGEIVMYIDGDLEVDPDKIKDYVKELGSFDIVVASRRHPFSEIEYPFSRRLLSRMFNLLIRIAIGIRVKDTQVGLKGGKGAILRRISAHMRINGFAFDVELLTIASVLNLKIKELPVKTSYKATRPLKISRIAKMFREILIISYKHRVINAYRKIMLNSEKSNHHLNAYDSLEIS